MATLTRSTYSHTGWWGRRWRSPTGRRRWNWLNTWPALSWIVKPRLLCHASLCVVAAIAKNLTPLTIQGSISKPPSFIKAPVATRCCYTPLSDEKGCTWKWRSSGQDAGYWQIRCTWQEKWHFCKCKCRPKETKKGCTKDFWSFLELSGWGVTKRFKINDDVISGSLRNLFLSWQMYQLAIHALSALKDELENCIYCGWSDWRVDVISVQCKQDANRPRSTLWLLLPPFFSHSLTQSRLSHPS